MLVHPADDSDDATFIKVSTPTDETKTNTKTNTKKMLDKDKDKDNDKDKDRDSFMKVTIQPVLVVM